MYQPQNIKHTMEYILIYSTVWFWGWGGVYASQNQGTEKIATYFMILISQF